MNTEILMKFVTLMTWVWGITAILVILLKIAACISYNKTGNLQRLQDGCLGVRRTFSIERWVILLTFCVAWIIVTWK